jgi:hypothetical protein
MHRRKRFLALITMVSLNLSLTGLASDSSADGHAMTETVKSSRAAMIRVPVDAAGRELISAAEMRLVRENVRPRGYAALALIWERGADVTNAPVADSSTDGDSSTWGYYWGWNAWRWANRGWYNPYYYARVWPTYYYYNYSYSYGSPYYYNFYYPFYYGNYAAWGYRYYYYPAGW